MDADDARLRERAEQQLQQRSLTTLAGRVTDPALRAQAQDYASGRISAQQFVRGMERSTTALRGFDRYMTQLASLPQDQREAMRQRRDQEIDRIADEFAQATASGPTRRRRRTAGPEPDEDESWENGTWLE